MHGGRTKDLRGQGFLRQDLWPLKLLQHYKSDMENWKVFERWCESRNLSCMKSEYPKLQNYCSTSFEIRNNPIRPWNAQVLPTCLSHFREFRPWDCLVSCSHWLKILCAIDPDPSQTLLLASGLERAKSVPYIELDKISFQSSLWLYWKDSALDKGAFDLQPIT